MDDEVVEVLSLRLHLYKKYLAEKFNQDIADGYSGPVDILMFDRISFGSLILVYVLVTVSKDNVFTYQYWGQMKIK